MAERTIPAGGPLGSVRRATSAAVETISGRRKIFYGWWLLAGAVVAMAIGSGVSFWSLTLYVEPLENEFGWSRAQVTGAVGVASAAAGLCGPFVGRWIDARGPRSVILVGAILTSATYVLMATTSTLWQWYLFSAVNSIFRTMMFFLPFQALVSRFFDRRRGVALGILGTGFSLGGFAVVPIVAVMIDQFGWNGSFVASGIIILAVFVPIALFLVKNSPADVGEWPDGGRNEPGREPPRTPFGLTLSEAIRTPNFWILAAAVTLFFYGMFGWMVHQVPFYESVGISTQTASFIVAASAGLGIFTRLAFGFVSDSVKSMELAALALAASLFMAMFTLSIGTGPAGIIIFVLFWIIGAGGGPMMEALLLTRAFGVKHFATIFGVFIVVETLGQVLSPLLAGAIFDSTGSYDAVLVMWMGTFAASVVLFLVASRLRRPMASLPPAEPLPH